MRIDKVEPFFTRDWISVLHKEIGWFAITTGVMTPPLERLKIPRFVNTDPLSATFNLHCVIKLCSVREPLPW